MEAIDAQLRSPSPGWCTCPSAAACRFPCSCAHLQRITLSPGSHLAQNAWEITPIPQSNPKPLTDGCGVPQASFGSKRALWYCGTPELPEGSGSPTSLHAFQDPQSHSFTHHHLRSPLNKHLAQGYHWLCFLGT